jgi:hypothetical protein
VAEQDAAFSSLMNEKAVDVGRVEMQIFQMRQVTHPIPL